MTYHKDSAKVPNEVNDKEDRAFLRPHRQVGASCIAFHRMSLSCSHEFVVDSTWTAEFAARGVGCEGEQEQNDEDHHRVDVVCEECGFDTAEHSVEYDSNWEKEASCSCWHSAKRCNDG